MWPFRKRTTAARAEVHPPVDLDRPVENPGLTTALAAHARASSDETARRLFAELDRANYLIATLDDVSSVTHGQRAGQSVIKKGSRLAILLLADERGRNFVPLFTDWREIQAWTDDRISTLVMPANEVWQFILGQSGYDGVVVNPAGASLPLDRDQIAVLQEGEMRQTTCGPGNEAENVRIENPELVTLLSEVQDDPSVRSEIYRLLANCNLLVGTREAVTDGPPAWRELQEDTLITFLTSGSPEGGRALPVFTDAEALHARCAEAYPLGMAASQIIKMVIEDGYDGLVLNPAADWIYIPCTDLQSLSA